MGLQEIPRKWQYAEISALRLDGDQYVVASPWSNQIVAGRQVLGDNRPPVADISLWRPATQETVSSGNTHKGFV